MLHREIENKSQARMIALQMADDIRQELECYKSYKVRVDDEYYVKVTSPQPCPILTGAALGDILDVVGVYEMLYKNYIGHHIGTEEWNERIIPSFIVSVGYKRY